MAKILVADDADIGRTLLKNLLKKEYEVVEASNGLEAIRTVQRERDGVDAVLLDLMMPVMDGMKTLAWFRENRLLERVPVIMLTAISDPAGIAACLDAGACDVIEKPYDPTVLMARIRGAIRRTEAIRTAAAESAEAAADGGDGGFCEAVLECLPNPVYTMDAKTRLVTFANAAFRSWPGMIAEPVGHTHFDMLPPSEAAVVADAENLLLKTHLQRPALVHGPDGNRYVVVMNALLDEKGEIETLVGSVSRVFEGIGGQG
ncbi:MAG: response regulator [Kiritimatiellae bacterium]|nr:response regulator [Kiritimatiellia bacterium]